MCVERRTNRLNPDARILFFILPNRYYQNQRQPITQPINQSHSADKEKAQKNPLQSSRNLCSRSLCSRSLCSRSVSLISQSLSVLFCSFLGEVRSSEVVRQLR